jgi:adenylosuccinate synthase
MGTESITLPLEELYKYKLLVLNRKVEDAKQALLVPLRQRYEEAYQKQSQEMLKTDPALARAQEAQKACIEELLAKLKDSLVEGYAVSKIDIDKGEIIAESVK